MPNLPFPSFHVMIKPHGAICNLQCKYCYYLEKRQLYSGQECRMTEETLEIFTRQFIRAQDPRCNEIVFGWQGGEPLMMGLAFFKKAIEFQKHYAKVGLKITNTIQTNGTLITEKWAQFFHDQNFLVGISVDGPENFHNQNRVNKGKQGSHANVIKGIKLLQDAKVEFNILCTVNRANIDYPLDVYRFFRDELKTQFIQFIPIINWTSSTHEQITPESITGAQFGHFLNEIFDEWIYRDVGKVFVQMFDMTLTGWMGQPPTLCTMALVCGNAVVVEFNGDVYSCDHFVDPDHYLGNIHQKDLGQCVRSPFQQNFGLKKQQELPNSCKSCRYRPLCNAGCPKHWGFASNQHEPMQNILCEGYLLFFKHSEKYMQQMAQYLRCGSPAARIMDQLKKDQ